jgi:hypothetical protein
LDLNAKGKEYVAKQLVTLIKVQTNKSEQTVLPLDWKKTPRQDEIKKCKNKDHISSEEDLEIISVEIDKQQGKIPAMLFSKRLRRPPTSRSDDFLW